MEIRGTLGNAVGRMLVIVGVALSVSLFATWFAAPAFAEETVQPNPDAASQAGGNGDTQSNLAAGTVENQPADQTGNSDAAQPADQAEESPIQPYTGKGTFYIQLVNKKNKVLGMKDGKRTNGVKVVVSKKKATNLQKFKISSAGKGLYYVQNVATGRLLTADIPEKKSTGNATMKMKSYDKAFLKNYQKWKIEQNKIDKTVTFTNVATGSRLSLAGKKTSNGTKLKVAKAADQTYQKFVLKKAKKNKKEI